MERQNITSPLRISGRNRALGESRTARDTTLHTSSSCSWDDAMRLAWQLHGRMGRWGILQTPQTVQMRKSNPTWGTGSKASTEHRTRRTSVQKKTPQWKLHGETKGIYIKQRQQKKLKYWVSEHRTLRMRIVRSIATSEKNGNDQVRCDGEHEHWLIQSTSDQSPSDIRAPLSFYAIDHSSRDNAKFNCDTVLQALN